VRIVALRAVLAVAAVGPVAYGSEGDTAKGPFTAAKACGSCHKAIYTYWSESPHSQASIRPSYLAALSAAVESAADKQAVRRDCIWCHAPTALTTGDYELKQPITKEGVTCDFCHTVADVDMDKPHRFEVKPGPVKRGPLQYAKSPFHQTEYSALHKSSPLLCAGCHEYRNALGVDVLSTYTEWKESPYPARGLLCQECHMPLVPGTTVGEGQSAQRVVNLHRLVGGSSAGKIASGMELRIESLSSSAAAADVQVVVTNAGVGHAAPGGLSSKTLVLAVGVETASGELMHRRERTYRRALNDAQGRALTTVADFFTKAAAVGEDTRIKPKESRTERFTVPLPAGSKAIVARLEYQDASEPNAAPRSILVTEQRRELAPR
jgi:hypothetical protein